MSKLTDIAGKMGIIATVLKGKPAVVADLRERAKRNRHCDGASFVFGSNDHALLVFVYGKSLKWYNKLAVPARKLKRVQGILRSYSTDEMKALAFKRMGDGWDSYDDHIIVLTKLGFMDLQQHLEDEFESHCTHSYDCCGGWYGNPWQHKTRMLFPGVYRVVIHSYMNV